MEIHIDHLEGLRVEHLSITQMAPDFSSDAMASVERLMQMLGRTDIAANAVLGETIQGQRSRPVTPGEYWHGQGGIYAGDFRAGDGSVYGLIVACEEDVGRARWAPNGKHDLSDWDGLANTQRLRNDCPAAKLAADYVRDEHTDFYLPARRELLLAAANLHDTFGKESWYWTSTPQGEHYAWAVGFESGYARIITRDVEFRVRPFRRFIY